MKTNTIMVLLALLTVAYGCQSEFETYSGENVIFMNQTTDTTRFSFTYVDSKFETQTQEIKIKTIGEVCDYDRVVNIKFTLTKAVEGTDFEPLEENYFVKAGETTLVIPIVMKRTEALQTEARIIDMELQENEYFKTYYDFGSSDSITWVNTNRLRQTLIFSEFMTQSPSQWNPYILGTFSPKKFKLICEEMGIAREKFLDYSYMGARSMYIGKYMNKYFAGEKAVGRTVYEEDGVTEMKMGPQAL